MRIVISILAISVLCMPGLAVSSTAGSLVLAADAAGSQCAVADDEPGTVKIHMLVREATGVTAVQFAAPTPGCWSGATWLGDNIAFPVAIGDTHLTWEYGLAIGFGECLESTVYIGYMLFNTTGASSPCCEYPIIKATNDLHPEIPGPIMVDCEVTHVEALTGIAVVNVGSGCNCAQTVANHETTWGGVKEMFR